MDIRDISLTFFFTQAVGLRNWADVGNLDRELEIYKKLSNHLRQVNMVTYGGFRDNTYSTEVGDIKLLPVYWWFKKSLTLFHILMRYFPEIKSTSILKTNQILGSEIPLWFKKRLGKKLITRCGYLYTKFLINMTDDKIQWQQAFNLERNAFTFADIGIVTSSRDRDYVIKNYKIEPNKIKVIPNYVVTDRFKPHPDVQKKYDLVYVGRSETQKNLDNLFKAINFLNKTKQRDISLLLVGKCCFDRRIWETIRRYKLNVTMSGSVRNFDLPEIINQARLFILPSYFEGHPKALLEAMSCSMPCIGTDVIGIREDIKHLVTGYLCDTNYKSIADAIDILLSDQSLQIEIGRNARNYIISNYSVDKILQMELDVIQEVLAS